MTYPIAEFGKLRNALADFSAHSQDTKAVVLATYVSFGGNTIAGQNIFYDGPTPPPGTFDNFTKIPSDSQELKTRSYFEMIASSGFITPFR